MGGEAAMSLESHVPNRSVNVGPEYHLARASASGPFRAVRLMPVIALTGTNFVLEGWKPDWIKNDLRASHISS